MAVRLTVGPLKNGNQTVWNIFSATLILPLMLRKIYLVVQGCEERGTWPRTFVPWNVMEKHMERGGHVPKHMERGGHGTQI